ncbi:MAG: hypothetical protein MR281_02065 [Eubacterium sp.]|nr:hypothetical protein [Eubacterium sp.]
MPLKLRKLLNNSRNINNSYSVEDMNTSHGDLIPFEFENSKYNLALRENALVFDDNMNLLYTFTFDELSTATAPFLKKVNEVTINNTNQKIILFVNRATGVEKLTFSSLFDATYIFNKLKRVAHRSSENIDSIMIEKNGTIVDNVKLNQNGKLFSKTQAIENRDERNDDKTELIASLSRVEDIIDDMICNNISKNGIQSSDERLEKCIEILKEIKSNNDAE